MILKAPNTIEREYLAPCGVNCMLCSRHMDQKRPPCLGCLNGGSPTSTHCKTCRIKLCAFNQGFHGCFECGKFPCKRIKTLEKRYREHYGYLLMEVAQTARQEGVDTLLAQQLAAHTCPDCGGLISLHTRRCSECGNTYPLERSETS